MKKEIGAIKGGAGTLIGNAGEHYVMAELLKRRIIAGQTPRNAQAFDILATDGKRTLKIRVKTKSEQYVDWQWVIKKDGKTIFPLLSRRDDYTVMVNLREQGGSECYVFATTELDRVLKSDHQKWVRAPGKNGRKHNPENTKRHFHSPWHEKELADHLNRWDLVFPEAKGA